MLGMENEWEAAGIAPLGACWQLQQEGVNGL